MLINDNRRLAEASGSAVLKEVNRERVEGAAVLEGISVEEAMERKKQYRFLY